MRFSKEFPRNEISVVKNTLEWKNLKPYEKVLSGKARITAVCGIAGLYMRSGLVEQETLLESARSLKHRGPDNTGTFVDGAFGMAHTRLSIIDLSGGDQPLFAKEGNLALVANGEIYNYIELRTELKRRGHVFSTNSDSEVILHAYAEHGWGFLEHLHGMFALALYDRANGRLILARDRLGIKPLFIAQVPGGLAFGSELKVLLSNKQWVPELNSAGLVQYFENQFSAGRVTVFKGVERLLPGEAVCIERGQVSKRWRYWSPLHVKPLSLTFEEAREQFDTMMETVMKQHMRSDVPFGLFLSGGVDSSILLALLTRYSKDPIRTFSVGFSDTRLVDELPIAEALARKFSSRHKSIRPSKEAIFFSLPFTVWAADELMRDYATLPTCLLAQAAGRELKVVFSGEGGDEVYAGYRRYRTSLLERWARNFIAPGSGGFRTRGTFRGLWRRRLFRESLNESQTDARNAFIEAWQDTPKEWTDLQRMQYVDLVTALPDNLLVKLDRMLMGWGVEGRVPFLDHRVVEFGLALPDRLKVEGGQGKTFLKRWASRFLPAEHLYGPKRGFHVPIGEWLKGDYLSRMRKILPRHPAILEWFRPEGVIHLIDHCGTSGPTSRMVWAILQFAVWYDLLIRHKGARPPVLQDPLELISK